MCENFVWNKIKFEASIALLNEKCEISCDDKFIYIKSDENEFIIPGDIRGNNNNLDEIRTYLNDAIKFHKYCIEVELKPLFKGFHIIHSYIEEQKMNYVDNVLMALPYCDLYQNPMFDYNIFIYIVPKFLFVFFRKN